MLRNKRGQSALEYGLLIAIVVIALLAINYYMRRGVTGRLKESTDQVGKQFDPTTFETSWKSTSNGTTTTQELRNGGAGDTTTNISASETVTRDEYDTFGNTVGSHF